jgi:HEAT repeat protein
MTRALPVLGCLVLLAAVAVAQQPSIQNGRVETRQATSIEREVAAAAASEPVWLGWRVPIVDGERGGCSTYISDDYFSYGAWLEGMSGRPPQMAQPAGPVPIEAGTGLVVLLRIVDGRVERLRTYGDDCPLDAGGRTLRWLDGVTPAESIRYLETLTRLEGTSTLSYSARQSQARTALSAIASHRDAAADAVVDRMAAGGTDEGSLRSHARSLLGRWRGAHGVTTLQQLLKTDTNADARRQLVSSLAQSRQPGVIEALRTLTRDADDKVRGEAVYYWAVRSGANAAGELVGLIAGESSDAVRGRAVSAMARWPQGAGVPHLITLARTSPSAAVRKQAVSSLSSSTDPRAIAYMEELLKR